MFHAPLEQLSFLLEPAPLLLSDPEQADSSPHAPLPEQLSEVQTIPVPAADTLSPATTAFHQTEGPDWIGRFLDHAQGRLSQETTHTYAKYVRQFLTWWKTHRADAPLTKDLSLAYGSWLKTPAPGASHPPVPPRTRALVLSSVRRWAAFLVAQGRLPQNPFDAVRGPNKPNELALGYLTEEQAQAFLTACPKARLPDFRDYLTALLMLRTGARETELCQANVGDVLPLGDEAVLHLQSKGKDKQEAVVLLADVKAEVDRYLARRTEEKGPLLPHDPLLAKERQRVGNRMTPHDIRRRLKRIFKGLKLNHPHITTLSLRQTAATEALLKGAALDDVQRMMRHESIETTRLYFKKIERVLKGAERSLGHLKAAPPADASSPSP
jgi:site-specific recombinase XerD